MWCYILHYTAFLFNFTHFANTHHSCFILQRQEYCLKYVCGNDVYFLFIHS